MLLRYGGAGGRHMELETAEQRDRASKLLGDTGHSHLRVLCLLERNDLGPVPYSWPTHT